MRWTVLTYLGQVKAEEGGRLTYLTRDTFTAQHGEEAWALCSDKGCADKAFGDTFVHVLGNRAKMFATSVVIAEVVGMGGNIFVKKCDAPKLKFMGEKGDIDGGMCVWDSSGPAAASSGPISFAPVDLGLLQDAVAYVLEAQPPEATRMLKAQFYRASLYVLLNDNDNKESGVDPATFNAVVLSKIDGVTKGLFSDFPDQMRYDPPPPPPFFTCDVFACVSRPHC
jgi:hypothetical protein